MLSLKKPMTIRRKMGYVPQELALHAVLSARRNLEFWAGVYGMRGTVRNEAVVRHGQGAIRGDVHAFV